MVNGSQAKTSDMAKEFKSGPTAQSTKAGGKTIKPMVKVDSFMLTGMSIMDSGWMIRLKDMECIFIWMGQDMKESGWKRGQMGLSLRDDM